MPFPGLVVCGVVLGLGHGWTVIGGSQSACDRKRKLVTSLNLRRGPRYDPGPRRLAPASLNHTPPFFLWLPVLLKGRTNLDSFLLLFYFDLVFRERVYL